MNSALAIVQEEFRQRCRTCGELKLPSAFYGDIDACKSCVRTRNAVKIRTIESRRHPAESNISNPEAQPLEHLSSLEPDRHPAYELVWVMGRLAELDAIVERRWEILHEKIHT